MRKSTLAKTAPLALALVAVGAIHCSSAPTEETSTPTAETLDGPGKAMCSLLNSIGSVGVGPVSVHSNGCSTNDYDNLYYLGSIAHRYGNPVYVSPQQRPQAMSESLYCALGYSHGMTADGTTSALGGMGIRSRVNITKRDAAAREVSGQRVGTLVIFGATADIEDQDFDATFPTEWGHVPASIVLAEHEGYYMRMKTSTVSWDIGGSASVPPFNFSVDLGQTGAFESMNNNGVLFSPPSQANVLHTTQGFDVNYGHRSLVCNACKAQCTGGSLCLCPADCGSVVTGNSCACPSASEISFEACATCSHDFGNLGDSQLPYYGGLGGAAGPYFYPETSYNWFHFGKPGMATVNGEPPAIALPDQAPSTFFHASLGFSLAFIELAINVDVWFRDSFVLAQGTELTGEHTQLGNVKTALDAQSEAQVSAHLVIDFPFPFISHPIVDLSYDILDKNKGTTTEAKGQASNGAHVAFDYTNGYPISTFTAADAKAPNATTVAACIQAPLATHPAVNPANPATFANAVSSAAIAELHPCHVDICPNGQHQTCEWNASIKNLTCVNAPGTCNACAASAMMCDAQGNVYGPTSMTRSSSCTPK